MGCDPTATSLAERNPKVCPNSECRSLGVHIKYLKPLDLQKTALRVLRDSNCCRILCVFIIYGENIKLGVVGVSEYAHFEWEKSAVFRGQAESSPSSITTILFFC